MDKVSLVKTQFTERCFKIEYVFSPALLTTVFGSRGFSLQAFICLTKHRKHWKDLLLEMDQSHAVLSSYYTYFLPNNLPNINNLSAGDCTWFVSAKSFRFLTHIFPRCRIWHFKDFIIRQFSCPNAKVWVRQKGKVRKTVFSQAKA